MAEDRRSIEARSVESLHDNLQNSEPAIFASYGLVGAILLFGGVGFFLDRWLGTAPWLVLSGLMTGLGLGLYGLVTTVRH